MANESHDSNLPSLLGAFPGLLGSSSSSSSFLAMSLESELDSSDTDNEGNEFIDELTRQMADYMLQEDDNDNNDKNSPSEGLAPQTRISKVNDPNKNKHDRVGKSSKQRRRGKTTRPFPSSGSCMRAIFLNRSGSNIESNGTGVFLPRSTDDPTTQNRKKLGCSIALVPTRVLEALEQHFNNLESLSPSNNLHRIQPTNLGQQNCIRQKFQPQSTSTDHVEKKLPKDWSY